MNKYQFLAELSQYLTFLSAEDRTKILDAYSARFDALDPMQEPLLIAELGSPMRIAIELKRRLEAGEHIIDGAETPPGESPDAGEEAAETEAESEAGAETESEAETASGADTEAVAEAEALPEEPKSPVPEAEAEILEDYSLETETEESLMAEEEGGKAAASPLSAELPEAEQNPEKKRPSGARLFFGLVGAFLLSLVIAVFFFGLAAVGGCFFAAAAQLMTAGLKNLQYLTNALLLFGGGLAGLALGLVILWFSIWAAIRLIGGLFRAARGTGPRKTKKEDKQK